MGQLHIEADITERKLVRPFVISTGARTHQSVLSVRLSDGQYVGRGEATGVPYCGETAESLLAQVRSFSDTSNLTRQTLMNRLPAGGARSALDAALWELEAAQAGQTVSDLIEIKPSPVASAFTIVLDTPDAMATQARDEGWRPLLKVKLGAQDEWEEKRILAVRHAAPDARLVIDANAGWTVEQLARLAPVARHVGYELIEQPLPMGCETDPEMRNALVLASSHLPLCADESFQTLEDFERCAGLYHYFNIKLDKCGGLTAALGIMSLVRDRGLGVFVGCMVAPTIAIAPAHLLAQNADYADLDGPFWFPEEPVELTDDGAFSPIASSVWGAGARHAAN